MLKWLTRRRDANLAAKRLYDAIVAQSRRPVFYLAHGVADTVTGRFEMIVVHMFLVLERLQSEHGETAARAATLGQALNEAFVTAMDDAMREMGVADIRVSERMHQAAGAFFGRLMAYRAAIAAAPAGANADGSAGDPLADALMRNVLAGQPDAGPSTAQPRPNIPGAARSLAAYMRAATADLASRSIEDLAAGTLSWPQPATMPP